jgi:hypothetical protein
MLSRGRIPLLPQQGNSERGDWVPEKKSHRSGAKGARVAGVTRAHCQFQSAETVPRPAHVIARRAANLFP